jgi:predicted  nucleic acid-binding Zn-ribbon protein
MPYTRGFVRTIKEYRDALDQLDSENYYGTPAIFYEAIDELEKLGADYEVMRDALERFRTWTDKYADDVQGAAEFQATDQYKLMVHALSLRPGSPLLDKLYQQDVELASLQTAYADAMKTIDGLVQRIEDLHEEKAALRAMLYAAMGGI